VRFILLTAMREGAAGGIRHRDEIDGRLTIPDTKSGRPHSLRLPPLALELLGNSEPNDLAFPGQDGGLLSWATPLDRLRHAGPQITERWHIHDLRRTCATHLQRLDVRPDVVEAVLNHAPPGISGVSGVYMRGELEDQKAAALRLWADEVASIISAPIVSPLRAAS
jgi:integrase